MVRRATAQELTGAAICPGGNVADIRRALNRGNAEPPEENEMPVQEVAEYLSERIACEHRAAALARSVEARRIHAELAMPYRCALAALRAGPAARDPS
jgi:hypothetical protein